MSEKNIAKEKSGEMLAGLFPQLGPIFPDVRTNHLSRCCFVVVVSDW